MRYGVTEEGVAALRVLSYTIELLRQEMEVSVDCLTDALDENAAGLGPHVEAIDALIEDLASQIRVAQAPVAELATSVRDVADSYQEVLDEDPYRVLGVAMGAVGAVSAGAAVAGRSSGGSGSEASRPVASTPPARTRAESSLSDMSEVTRKVPGLTQTTQATTRLPNGNTMFDSPGATGKGLNNDQGGAVKGFSGTCGLCSCENVARMAGKDVTEADVVEVALRGGHCSKGSKKAGDNGGTSPQGRQAILSAMGIDSVIDRDLSIDHIASEIEAGKGVIASVDVARFWPGAKESGSHAITVTSVERDSSGKVVAVYVCDSGSSADDSSRRVDAGTFVRSLTGRPLNVTAKPIR